MRPSWLDELAADHASGRRTGVTSVCSAHPLVLDQSLRRAARSGDPVLIEATCNQVNQEGGYTGLTPAAFRAGLDERASRIGLARDQIRLGGDHLGPNPWKHLPAKDAMAKSEAMVDAFASAGYNKLHLDTSIRCADDPSGPLATAVVAQRAARLAAVAERAAGEHAVDLRYVIGSEVPVPGGESSGRHGIEVSAPADVAETVQLCREAFVSAGQEAAWEKVRVVVAQPGVEFSDQEIFRYRPGQAAHLYAALESDVPLVFEAHSTDYQHETALRALVDDHFAILKVGPGLTFAYREAVFGLCDIEDVLLGDDASHLRDVLDRAMRKQPEYWRSFYAGDEATARLARAYSRSDRSRYYWPDPSVQAALSELTENLARTGIPDELASQFLSWVRGGEVPGVQLGSLTVEDVLRDAIDRVLDVYDRATQSG